MRLETVEQPYLFSILGGHLQIPSRLPFLHHSARHHSAPGTE